MNFTLTSKVKSLLAYLVPVAMVSPSLIWIALDRSVWMWDEAIFGKGSVELLYAESFTQALARLIFNILHEQAPGVSWLGQFFVPVGLLGSIDTALLVSIILTQALTLLLMCRAASRLAMN